jgi:methylmalonyl-CoA/ethylmalonyl-CoA epimerase
VISSRSPAVDARNSKDTRFSINQHICGYTESLESSGAFTFQHLGVAVASMEKALKVYEDLFGYRLISGPFHDPIQKVSVCFLGANDITIELVEPLDDQSPIRKTLEKGGGAYHVCYEVPDLDGTLRNVSDMGCIIVSRPAPAVAFGNRRIAWFYTPTRQLIEIVEKSLER